MWQHFLIRSPWPVLLQGLLFGMWSSGLIAEQTVLLRADFVVITVVLLVLSAKVLGLPLVGLASFEALAVSLHASCLASELDVDNF